MNKINWNFSQYFSSNNFLLYFGNLDSLFHYSIDRLLDFNIDVFDNLDLFDLCLNDRHMHYPFNLAYYFPYHLFLYHFLYYLRHLHYFLNDSWNNHNFLYNLFYFYYFGNLYHLFNHLFYNHFDLFNTINYGRHFYYLLFNVFDHLRNININIDILDNL